MKRIRSIPDKLSLIILATLLFFNLLQSASTETDSSQVLSADSSFHPDQYFPYLDDGTPWRRNSDVKWGRLSVIITGFAISDAIGFKKLSQFWYKTERTSFHFHENSRDIRENKQMDKIAHFIDAYYFSHLASKIYRWGGLSVPKSVIWGSITGSVWMLQIEIVDGFFKRWGFSQYDFMMNILGSSYSALQQLYPEQLKGIHFKVGYFPSEAYRNKLYSEVSRSIADDYEGYTFWLCFNPYDLLPKDCKRSFPGWLAPWGIAIGYGAQNIATDVFNGQREIYFGLDFDLNKLPTGNNNFVKFMKDEFNILRLPLPTVRVSPTTIWFGFYF
jgi:hypothetical protein